MIAVVFDISINFMHKELKKSPKKHFSMPSGGSNISAKVLK